MKKIILFLLMTVSLYGQTHFQSFLNRVNSAPTSQKTAIVDSFITYARTVGIPFCENGTATFLYRGTATNVYVAGDMNSWTANVLKLVLIPGTNLLYKTQNYESNARLDYKFVLNGSNYILDPENPHTCLGGFGPNSELAMPGYIQPWEIRANTTIPQFLSQQKTLHSTILNRNYSITVLLPPGYNSSSNSYPAVYFQDGSDYLNLANAKNIFQNILDSNKIANVIAVFVTPTNREDEYAGANRFKYSESFVTELVPYIDANYRTIQDKGSRLVIGDSFGGNISALISYTYPDVFANCGLHSPAFWPFSYEVYNLIAKGVKKDIKFYSVWGSYESLNSNVHQFIDSLNSKGYTNDYGVYPEGHSWGLWRATTDQILQYFFPAGPVSVDNSDIQITDYKLYQNYPNPFNPTTTISFNLKEQSDIELFITNIIGQKIKTVYSGVLNSGFHKYDFNAQNLSSGVYFYTLKIKSTNLVLTNKMIVLK